MISLAAAAAVSAPFWLGPSFEELPLTHREADFFVYGDCDPPPDEGGCSPPLQIQNDTACGRNPVGLDVVPRSIRPVYAWTDRRAERAALALRRTSQSRPRRLPAPVFPRPVLAELKRALAGPVPGLPPGHLRARRQVARLLPAGTLRHVEVPRRSWRQVERDRQVAFAAQTHEAQKRFGLSRAEVLRAVRRTRGLVGEC